jgi:phospholipid/cholesterol/gamma-HCH transport system ATP-binding protein
MSSTPIVEIRDLHFGFAGQALLRGVDLDIPRGQIAALLGASGSGKTTLMKLIGGQLRPDRGEVRVNGQVVHRLDSAGLYRLRREMGMMFQAGGLFSDLSVFDNVAFPLREHTDLPDDMIRDLVLMKLHAVGLRGAHGLMTGELSGGMARRVALARATALDPGLILYDEPFAGLDPISLNVIANIIRRLNDALGTSAIVVTYDVAESLKVVDQVYFLDAGRIVAHGTPAAMHASDHPFVRQFIDGEQDGPVGFHAQARALAEEFGLA